MLRGMSFQQLQEWEAFAELEPFDDSRADVRASAIIAALYELRRDPEKRAEPFIAADFALLFGDDPRRDAEKEAPPAPPVRSWQEMRFMAEMIVASAPRK